LLFLLIAWIPSPDVRAEDIVFVTGGISPPYVYEEDGQILGMDRDVVAEFCKANGISPEFRALPWKRALNYAERGRSGGIFSLFRSEDREQFLYYPSTPINSVRTVVLSRKDSDFTVRSLDDLKGQLIGVVDGHRYGPEFDNFSGLDKFQCRDKEELIRMLYRKRVDMIIDSEDVFWHMCRRYGVDTEKFTTLYVIRENPIYVAFSRNAMGKKGENLAEKFDIFFKKISKNGILNKIRSRYR